MEAPPTVHLIFEDHRLLDEGFDAGVELHPSDAVELEIRTRADIATHFFARELAEPATTDVSGKTPKTRFDWPAEFKDEVLARLLAGAR
jgi:hypothetical protein